MNRITKPYLDVIYDSTLCNWNEAIEQELQRLAIDRRLVTIIARPRTKFEAERMDTDES